MTNKLLIISLDALNAKDLEYIKKLEHIKTFFQEGSYVKNVFSVYPTLTYCCHSSIITGNYPDKHGIYHNEYSEPEYSLVQNWHWLKKDLQSTTLFDLAKADNLKTANVLWPVMGSAGNTIDYNIPEVWSDRGISNTRLFLKHGTWNMIPTVIKNKNLMDGKNQPALDDFSLANSIQILLQKQPDLMTIHFTELDTIRHKYGVFSKEAYEALDHLDYRIGKLIDTLKKAGNYENTNIILLGDHGGNDFDQMILINSIFLKEGLLEVDSQDTIKNWVAYANGAGGSVQIHLKNPHDKDLYDKVRHMLEKLTVMPGTPIKALYTKDEVQESEHLSGDFSFVLEAQNGYVFRNHVRNKLVIPSTHIAHAYLADHGFLPEHENLRTLLLGKGPDIAIGSVIEECTLVDEGPTFARLLNLQFENTDGNIIEGFIKS